MASLLAAVALTALFFAPFLFICDRSGHKIIAALLAAGAWLFIGFWCGGFSVLALKVSFAACGPLPGTIRPSSAQMNGVSGLPSGLLNDPLRRGISGYGFLSHLHSLR